MRIWLVLLFFCLSCSAENPCSNQHHKTQSPTPIFNTAVYHVRYCNAANASQFITKMQKQHHTSLLITSYPRARLLFIRGPENDIKLAKHWLNLIDTPDAPIEIDAKIVTLDQKYVQNLGVSLSQRESSSPNIISIPIWHTPTLNLLNLQIRTLCKKGHADILANPRLTTLNGHPASIEAGTAIPYQEKTKRGDTTIKFKKASLKLKVTPTILTNQQIRLQIQLHHDTPSIWMIKGEPAIKTQELNTTVVLRNNETIALGGIINDSDKVETHAIPLLHLLPLIGHFFRVKRNH